MSPSRVLSRYAPLVAVLAVQAMLVLGAPTGSTTVSNAAGGGNGPGGLNTTTSGVVPNGPARPSGQVGGGQTAGGGTASGPGGTTASGPIANVSTDRSRCDKNNREIGVTTYMPLCVPVWKGNNGGATMPGVTGNQIKIVFVVPQANAEVNAI